MPELPEVEVTRRRIARRVVGGTIAAVRTTGESYVFLTPPRILARRLRGRTVVALARIGKYLVATLDGGDRLLLHLGMTGDLFPGPFRPDTHTHLRLRFAGGAEVFFRDVRKFGKVLLVAAGERAARLERLGTDALEARPQDLFGAGRRRRAPVKTLLLDQSVLAGVGNIYADEALFRAGIRPTRPARRLSREDCGRLVRAVKGVLRRAIAAGAGYEDDRRFQVYGRAGRPCRRCDATVRRLVIGQRSTHFCPRCQR